MSNFRLIDQNGPGPKGLNPPLHTLSSLILGVACLDQLVPFLVLVAQLYSSNDCNRGAWTRGSNCCVELH